MEALNQSRSSPESVRGESAPFAERPNSRLANRRARQRTTESATVEETAWWSVFKHPAVWVCLALVATVIEGALRKWVPGFQGGAGRLLAYFSKDVFFGVGVLCLLMRGARSGLAVTTFGTWFMAAGLALLVGGGLSLTHGFNLVGTGLSVRALVVLPLLVILFANRTHRFPLLQCAVMVVLLALMNLPLGLLQNRLPEDHLLNQFAEDEVEAVRVEYGIRAAGTFAYIAGMSVMSAAGVWAGMVVVSLGRDWKYQFLGVLGILAGFGCAFASISRGAVVTAAAMLGLWALSSFQATKVVWRLAWMGAVAALCVLLFFPNTGERFLHVGEGVLTRFNTAGDDNMERAVGQWGEMSHAVMRHPFGLGLGTQQVGGNYAAKGVMAFSNYESQFPRIVAEFGMIGLLGFFALVVGTVWSLQVAKQEAKSKRWSMAFTATQVFVLGQMYGSLVFNHTASAFVWLAVAASLAALPPPPPRMKRQPNPRRALGQQTSANTPSVNSATISADEPLKS